MESVAVGVAGIAVVWLIIWTVRNGKAPSIGDQKGLFRMVDHEANDKAEIEADAGRKE